MTLPAPICLVTGATAGLGLATTIGLARRGATVFMTYRDPARRDAALAAVRRALGPTAASAACLVPIALDLASWASVRAAAAEVETRTQRLEVLIANAGVAPRTRQLTVDGVERTMAVNHLGHALLIELLLPLMRRSAPARIVLVGSHAHRRGRLELDDLAGRGLWSPGAAYARSKLAVMLTLRALDRRLAGSGVTVNAVRPGLVATELDRDYPRPWRALNRVLGLTPAEGAWALLRAALAPELAGVSGRYLSIDGVLRPSRAAGDDRAADALWECTLRLVGRAPATGA